MSWRWCKPASAVSTIWGYSPRHGGGSPPAAGRKACRERSRRVAHVCTPNELPTSSLQLPTSSSGFWSPVVLQFRDPGRITGNSTGVPGLDFAPLEPSALTIHLQPRASSSGFWSPVDSTGVPGPDFQPLELLSPLQCTVTKNEPVSPLESALTQSLDLKCPGMNTYKKRRVGGRLRANQHST